MIHIQTRYRPISIHVLNVLRCSSVTLLKTNTSYFTYSYFLDPDKGVFGGKQGNFVQIKRFQTNQKEIFTEYISLKVDLSEYPIGETFDVFPSNFQGRSFAILHKPSVKRK